MIDQRSIAEKLFIEEIRDKKQGFSGVRAKTGKRGYVGKLYTMDDMLKGKEKRAYRGTTKIRRYNMYDNILAREEFERLDEDTQKKAILEWRDKFPTNRIYKELGMGAQTFYNLMDSLNIERTGRGNGTRKQKKVTNNNNTVNVVNQVAQPKEESSSNGLDLGYAGVKSVEEISSILLSFATLLEAQKGKFEIELRIKEK